MMLQKIKNNMAEKNKICSIAGTCTYCKLNEFKHDRVNNYYERVSCYASLIFTAEEDPHGMYELLRKEWHQFCKDRCGCKDCEIGKLRDAMENKIGCFDIYVSVRMLGE